MAHFVHTYENQRRYPVAGFKSSLLPTDRSQFSTENGKQQLTKEMAEFTLPSGAKFSEEWKVEIVDGTTDEEGWMYAFDFPLKYHAKKGFTDCVRRRKWVRHYNEAAAAAAPTAPKEVPGAPTAKARDPSKVEPTVAHPTYGGHAHASLDPQHTPPHSSDDEVDETKRPTVKPKNVEITSPNEKKPTNSKAPPPPPPPEDDSNGLISPEHRKIIEAWKKNKGSRCGGASITVSIPTFPNAATDYYAVIEYSGRKKQSPVYSKAATVPFSYEEHLLIADDSMPITITYFEPGPLGFPDVCKGSATFALRTIGEFPNMNNRDIHVEKLVSSALVYTEMGQVVLPLYPRPDDIDRHLANMQPLGDTKVEWMFELRDPAAKDTSHSVMHFCDVCGQILKMCSCEHKKKLQEKESHLGDAVAPPRFKSGRMILRLIRGEHLLGGATSVMPYVIVHFSDPNGYERKIQSTIATVDGKGMASFEQPLHTYTIDIPDLNHSAHPFFMEVWDHCRLGKDKCLGDIYIDPLTAIGGKILNVKLKPSASMEVTSAELGSLSFFIDWIPYNL